jgi:hypothetical protein
MRQDFAEDVGGASNELDVEPDMAPIVKAMEARVA